MQIKAGHVFIDVEGTKNRILEFEASTGTTTASMGDSINPADGTKIHFTVEMIVLQGAYPEIVQDGQPAALMDKSPSSHPDETRSFDYVSDGKDTGFE
jgi:hypothetical protein